MLASRDDVKVVELERDGDSIILIVNGWHVAFLSEDESGYVFLAPAEGLPADEFLVGGENDRIFIADVDDQ